LKFSIHRFPAWRSAFKLVSVEIGRHYPRTQQHTRRGWELNQDHAITFMVAVKTAL